MEVGRLGSIRLLGDMVAVCEISRDDNGGIVLPQERLSILIGKSNTFIPNCHEQRNQEQKKFSDGLFRCVGAEAFVFEDRRRAGIWLRG